MLRFAFAFAYVFSIASMFASGLQATPFDAAQMTANAKKNGRYCALGKWNSHWLGPQNRVSPQPVIALSGTDLSFYRANVEPTIHTLYRLNVAAAGAGKISPLKKFMLSLAKNSHFTKLAPYRPQTWEGTKPAWLAKYNPYNEPAFYAAILLIAAAQSYAILEPHLSTPEKKLLRGWGDKIFKASARARDDKKGADRMAAKAAGFTSWGLVTGNSSAFKKGKLRFRSAIKDINRDGRSKFFSKGHNRGKELKYMNMEYGFLSVAASALEANGQSGFAYKSGGGSLIDGLNFLISRTLNPSLRKKISPSQKDATFHSKPRHVTVRSWTYLEYVANSSVGYHGVPLLGRALSVRGGSGFFSGYYGGYTSCLIKK